MNQLVIVSGPSGSGKTYLAKYLSENGKIPCFSKDGIKEKLFDVLGWSDKDQSMKLGTAAIKFLYMLTEEELRCGRKIIIEANFKPELDRVQIEKFQYDYNLNILEFHCFATNDVLVERSRQRVIAGERHPGHLDDKLSDRYFDPLVHGEIGVGKVVKVDTSDFSKVDYVQLLNFIV